MKGIITVTTQTGVLSPKAPRNADKTLRTVFAAVCKYRYFFLCSMVRLFQVLVDICRILAPQTGSFVIAPMIFW